MDEFLLQSYTFLVELPNIFAIFSGEHLFIYAIFSGELHQFVANFSGELSYFILLVHKFVDHNFVY